MEVIDINRAVGDGEPPSVHVVLLWFILKIHSLRLILLYINSSQTKNRDEPLRNAAWTVKKLFISKNAYFQLLIYRFLS